MSKILFPFTAPRFSPSIIFERGEGSTVYDNTGKKYLDAAGSLWNVTHGLSNHSIISKINQQYKNLSYSTLFGSNHSPAQHLSRKLTKLTNSKLPFTFYSTTGSSAIEVAVRVARLSFRCRGLPKKRIVVSFDNSYHGGTLFALSLSGLERDDLVLWDIPEKDIVFIPGPDRYKNSIDNLTRLFAENHDHIAAFLVEPVLGSAGVIIPTKEYCSTVSDLCKKYDVRLLCDEVVTGGGRCGNFFASWDLGYDPDAIALSKGINSGYSALGVTLFSEKIISPIYNKNAPILYGCTQDGAPVSCAAALEVISQTESLDLFKNAKSKGAFITDRLMKLDKSQILTVRSMGMMIGIDLLTRDGRQFNKLDAESLKNEFRDKGLLLFSHPRGLSLFPSLIMTDQECDLMLTIISEVLV